MLGVSSSLSSSESTSRAPQSSEASESSSSRSRLVRKGRPILIATLLSRPLGFIREAVQAALFGASRLTDAFLVAYNVPEMIQTLFFSGVLSNFFVPVMTRYRTQKEELSTVFSLALNGAFGIALLLASLCYVAAPGILTVAAPGLVGADHDLAVFLFRFMLCFACWCFRRGVVFVWLVFLRRVSIFFYWASLSVCASCGRWFCVAFLLLLCLLCFVLRFGLFVCTSARPS